MSNIDPNRGTHFNGKRIVVSSHAKDEAVSKFGKHHRSADIWITENLRKSAYVGEILSDEGDEVRRLFGYRRISFVLAKDTDTVITVYPRHAVEPTLRSKVEEIIVRELRKARRKFERISRNVELEKADLAIERAECNRRMVRTKSEAVRLAMEARIKAIDEYCAQLDEDVAKVQQEKSTLAKGVVAYL